MVYEIKVPDSGFSVTEGTIIEWVRKVGEKVYEGETVVIIETEKVTVEIPALVSGVLVEIRFEKGEVVPVGAVLGLIAEEGDSAGIAAAPAALSENLEERARSDALPGRAAASEGPSGRRETPRPAAKRKISPVARKLAEREGVDLSLIEAGSGPGGRIIKEDVLRFAEEKKATVSHQGQGPPQPPPGEKIMFTGWRKIIADRMVASARNIPQGRTLMEVDVTELSSFIASLKKRIEKPKITYLPFLMKAIQAGVEVTPEVNAFCYEEGFVLQRELNIGMAVEVGEKLVVPVIKNVREKCVLELAEEIQAMAHRAREEKLKPDEVQGGTITITNLGPFDVYAAIPLILPPQTTIIAMGTVRDQPWISEEKIEMRKKVMVTGVFDHRAVNGAPGARFLRELKTHLEDISNLILGMR